MSEKSTSLIRQQRGDEPEVEVRPLPAQPREPPHAEALEVGHQRLHECFAERAARGGGIFALIQTPATEHTPAALHGSLFERHEVSD